MGHSVARGMHKVNIIKHSGADIDIDGRSPHLFVFKAIKSL